MLKRKIYEELLSWKKKSCGQTALLIEGARRVGKSFIAELFAKQEYKSCIIIDFGNAPQDILDLFQSHVQSDHKNRSPDFQNLLVHKHLYENAKNIHQLCMSAHKK